MIDHFFWWCVGVLQYIGTVTGMGYNLANIVIFVILQPGLILLFLFCGEKRRKKNRNRFLRERSVARCPEPHFVNPRYIIIILQPKAQNWFFTASVLRQKLRQDRMSSMKKLLVIIVLSLFFSSKAFSNEKFSNWIKSLELKKSIFQDNMFYMGVGYTGEPNYLKNISNSCILYL